jgi:hypothetical protein
MDENYSLFFLGLDTNAIVNEDGTGSWSRAGNKPLLTWRRTHSFLACPILNQIEKRTGLGPHPTLEKPQFWPLFRGMSGALNLVGQVTLPTVMTGDVKPGENAAIATRKGPLANGHVSSISPSTSGDTRTWISPSASCPKELAQASKWTALLTSKRSTAFSTSDAPYTAPRTPVFPYSRS